MTEARITISPTHAKRVTVRRGNARFLKCRYRTIGYEYCRQNAVVICGPGEFVGHDSTPLCHAHAHAVERGIILDDLP